MNLFCQFQTVNTGKCLMYLGTNPSSEFCKRHFGKKEKIKTHNKKTRGNSKWQKENGMFKSKVE